MMQQYELPTQDRKVRFTGQHLSHASSRYPGSLRWTEIDIYRTEGGHYILSRQGRSVVYHRLESDCVTKYAATVQVGQLVDEAVYDLAEPCPICQPNDLDDLAEDDVIRLEQTNPAVFVSNDTHGLIESAKNRDRDGQVFMNRVTATALRLASEQDHAIAEAFMVEDVA